MKTDIVEGLVSILGGRVGTVVLGLLISPLLVRTLGGASYGNYAFLLSILGLAMIVVDSGIFDGTRKYVAEDRDEDHWIETVFGFYFVLSVIASVLAASGFVLLARLGLGDQYFGAGFDTYLLLLGVLIVARQLYSVVTGGLMGLGLERYTESLRVSRIALFGLIGVSLAATGYGVAGVLAGHIVATFAVTAVSVLLLSRQLSFDGFRRVVTSNLPVSELLLFNSFNVILVLLTASLYHVDVIFLQLLVGSEQTGYYRAALVVAEFLWFGAAALETVLLHSSSELWSRAETERITDVVSTVTRYNLALLVLLTIGLATLAYDFVPLYYGTDFTPATRPLLILLPGVIGFGLAQPIYAVGQGKGEFRALIYATGAAAALNLALNLLLIPTYGMVGAAVATSIGYGSMAVLHVRAARTLGYDPIDDLRLGGILAAAVPTAIVVAVLAYGIGSSVLSLVLVPPIGFVVYASLILRFGVVDAEHVESIESRLPEELRFVSARIR